MSTNDRGTFTVSQFCEWANISRTLFYELQKDGTGPQVFYVRSKPLISIEAAEKWRQEREQKAPYLPRSQMKKSRLRVLTRHSAPIRDF